MTYRTRQFNNDEDLPLNGNKLTEIGGLLFDALLAGTVPLAAEIIYADGFHQASWVLVRDRLQVGSSNASVLHRQAAQMPIDSRTRTLTHDAAGRLTTLVEAAGQVPVKTVENTLDGLGRITEMRENLGGKTTITQFTYDDNTERIATMTRFVV